MANLEAYWQEKYEDLREDFKEVFNQLIRVKKSTQARNQHQYITPIGAEIVTGWNRGVWVPALATSTSW